MIVPPTDDPRPPDYFEKQQEERFRLLLGHFLKRTILYYIEKGL